MQETGLSVRCGDLGLRGMFFRLKNAPRLARVFHSLSQQRGAGSSVVSLVRNSFEARI